MTETLTFNRNDWSGRSATVEATTHADGTITFEWAGYIFTLSAPVRDDEAGFTKRVLTNPDWDAPLFSVFQFDGEAANTAMSMGIERGHQHPAVAACQMLANIL